MKNLNEETPSSSAYIGTASFCSSVTMQKWKPKSTAAVSAMSAVTAGTTCSYGVGVIRYARIVVTPPAAAAAVSGSTSTGSRRDGEVLREMDVGVDRAGSTARPVDVDDLGRGRVGARATSAAIAPARDEHVDRREADARQEHGAAGRGAGQPAPPDSSRIEYRSSRRSSAGLPTSACRSSQGSSRSST